MEFLTHDCIGPDDVETDEYLLLPYAVSCTQMIEIVILALAGFKTPQQPEPLPARNQGRERLLQLRTLQVLDTTPPCPRFWGRRRWQTRLAKRLAEVYSE